MLLPVPIRVVFLGLCVLGTRSDVTGEVKVEQPSQEFPGEAGNQPVATHWKSTTGMYWNRNTPADLRGRTLEKSGLRQVELTELRPVEVMSTVQNANNDGQANFHRVRKSEIFTEFEDVFAYRDEEPHDEGDAMLQCSVLDAIQNPSKSVEVTEYVPEMWVLPGFGFEGLVVSLISNLYEERTSIVSASDLGIVDNCYWNYFKLATFQQTWTFPDTWGVEIVRNNQNYRLNTSLNWWANFFRGYKVEAVCRRCALSSVSPSVCTPVNQTPYRPEELPPESTTLSDIEVEAFPHPPNEHGGRRWHGLPRPKTTRETSETEVIHRKQQSSPPPFPWVWVGPLVACFILSATLVVTCTLFGWLRTSGSKSRTHPVEEGEQEDCSSTVFSGPESEINQSTTPLT